MVRDAYGRVTDAANSQSNARCVLNDSLEESIVTSIAIMQPYFCPYIGYFQLIQSADVFVIYDNIEYTKKGWINRNRFLANGEAATFSLALKKDSDHLDVRERFLAENFDRRKLLNRIEGAYRKAPYFDDVLPLLKSVVLNEQQNLFAFIHHSVAEVCDYLGITTRIVRSSHVEIDHSLRGQDKVVAICQAFQADTYINPIGGRELYAKETFRNQGLELRFLQTGDIVYPQLGAEFVASLSIIDVMMFNARQTISEDLLQRCQFQ